jgi:CRP/FNR family cyclic AMP-dependent transcriptional regulator
VVSLELFRCYPFFGGLSSDQIRILAEAAEEMTLEAEHILFREGDSVEHFYLVREGVIGIAFEIPARDVEHKLSEQFDRKLQSKDVVVSTVGPGEVFGWSGLIPPYQATAKAKTMTPAKIVSIDCRGLREIFEEDCQFAHLMTRKAAQVIRKRLHDMRIEWLAYLVD